jgi:colicin import membrane protein
MSDKESQLVTIEPTKAYEVFTTPNGLVELLAKIDHDALSIAPDLSTATGRKAVASNAYRVAQTKTYLDNLGKEITDKLKELPKLVDANRKYARETLDELKEKIRQPLTDWEAEQERIEAAKKAEEQAAKLREEIERCHELALFINAEFDRKREEDRKAAEQARIEHERRIAEEAAERARLAAEAKAKAEREESERNAREAAEAAERAKREAIEAAEKAERDRIEAEERHARELQAAQNRIKAEAEKAAQQERERIEAEQRRIQAEQEAKAKAEAKAAANKEHQRKINSAIVSQLICYAGISDTQAKSVVKAVLSGQVDRVSINYGVEA